MDQGPRSFRVGRHVKYRREDVEAWLENQMATTARGGVTERPDGGGAR
ncbi:hypothetical protein MOTT12_03330 [Mycobacterium intracellulare subsp. yongonense]|nr:hypothetical protein MOTT12_03330 [Mycobacterium intracellulare subsp. yongonense]ARR84064.1 hypothetical protein MOTT27_03243 [Mycobacterium intracellulare subsp. yongonense]